MSSQPRTCDGVERGGSTCRRGGHAYAATLTTMGTPHRGSPYAVRVDEAIRQNGVQALLQQVPLPA